MKDFSFGVLIGAIVVGYFALMVAISVSPKYQNTLKECRAANPGYDCSTAWMKSEPF